MKCDALIHGQPDNWLEETPFLLWEIGGKTVIEHWVDVLYESNIRMVLWLEEVDARILTFVNGTFPLSRNTAIRIGLPEMAPGVCTYLDEDGKIVTKPVEKLRSYLPPGEVTSRIWFKMVRNWLADLQKKGSNAPELDEEIQPGVFVGHHCKISRRAELIPPCWIGSSSTIGDAQIGPFAIIAENCFISSGTRVTESYVLRNTFLGERLTLDGLVAGRNGILRHRTGTLARIADGAIICAL